MTTPDLIPVLYMPNNHGKDAQCAMCNWPFRKGEEVYWDEDSGVMACKGESHLHRLWFENHVGQLMVDAEEAIQEQGEVLR